MGRTIITFDALNRVHKILQTKFFLQALIFLQILLFVILSGNEVLLLLQCQVIRRLTNPKYLKQYKRFH